MLDHAVAPGGRRLVLASHHVIRAMITTRVRGKTKIFPSINLASSGFGRLKSRILP